MSTDGEKLLVRLFHRQFGVIVIVTTEPRDALVTKFFPNHEELVTLTGRDEFNAEVELYFSRNRENEFGGLTIARVPAGMVLPMPKIPSGAEAFLRPGHHK